MIIATENEHTSEIAGEDVFDAFEAAGRDPRPVEFGDDGQARVPAEVGEYLAETYDAITVETDERTSDDTNTDTED